jgi:hypothetical protein
MNNLFLITPNQKNIQRALLGLIVILSLMMGSSLPVAQAQEGAPALFSDAGTADMALDNPAHVIRSRVVKVNFGLLFAPNGQALDASVNPEVTLNLFPDATYTGVVERVEDNFSGSKSWIGRLKEKEGYFYLVDTGAAFIAHVASREGIYEVSLVGRSLYKVVQIDQSKLREDAPGLVDHADPVLLDPNLDVAADPASTIDVMVFYTDDAAVGEGGTAAMRARIDLAMTETKASYINAGVTPRLRLIHAAQINYAETGFLDIDLNRLLNPSDGFLDGVHNLRNFYGADMVTLIVENADGCGLAADILADATTGFQVTARDGCMTGNYSFGHEFGHLQGARHDLYVDPTNTPYAFGHGYVNTTNRWRTVMAYNDKCADTAPFSYCPRLQYFSNPGKFYGGAPTGAAGSAENYKVLNTTALTVANFRQAKIGANFFSNFPTVSPWQAVSGTWNAGTAPTFNYIASTGVPGLYSSIQYPSQFASLTYQARLWRKGCASCANSLIIRGNPASLAPDKSWQPSYEFSYSNDGYISVWKIFSNGSYVALKNWTPSAAVAQGTWNTLKVIAADRTLKFYVNGTLVFAGADASLRMGKVGVSFYRDNVSTGNKLFVDWAGVSNTPTGGVVYDEKIDDSGVTVEGGTPQQSP